MKKAILVLLLALTCLIINATATHFVDVETTGAFVVSPNAGYFHIYAELDGTLATNQRIYLSYPPIYNNPTWLIDGGTSYLGNNRYRIKVHYLANTTTEQREGWFRIDLQEYNQAAGIWDSYPAANTHIQDYIFQYCNTAVNPYQAAITNAPDNSTVTIPAGVHIGHLEISGKNNLTIKGAGMTGSNATTIRCAGNASAISITNCTNLTIQDMIITNGMAETGSGINCFYSTVTIENCLIRNNRFRPLYSGGSVVLPTGYGGAIYLDNPSNSTFNVISSIIHNNHAAEGETAFVVGGKLNFDKCNLLQNNSASNYVGWPNSFTFWNSIIASANVNVGTYNYCCSYNPSVTLPGSHNIRTADPMFTDPSNGDFSLQKGSPCIGAGYNPEYDGPRSGYDQALITVCDETQEIGAIDYDWDRYTTYTFTNDPDGNWMCFPVVDDYSTVMIDGTSYTKNVMRAFFLQYETNPSDMDYVKYKWYDSGSFVELQHTPSQPSYDTIKSYLGYKAVFNRNSVMPPTGKLHGYHIPYTDPVPIPEAGTECWIGYFVPETQSPLVAFASILDELYFIKAKDWAMARIPNERDAPWFGVIHDPLSPNMTLSYGDMVAVKKFADSQQDQFTWSRQITVPMHQRSEPEHFTFTKEADYSPIFVEVDSLSTFKELAVLVEGDCYGAAVVDCESVMIPAYIGSIPNGAQIQIVGWDGSKSKSTPLDLQVYNSNVNVFHASTSITKEDCDFYYVKLGESEGSADATAPLSLEVSNYPNPFNPSTTIRYTVPNDGNVNISVYNIKGQLVVNLVNEHKIQGSHSAIWDGEDNHGKQVSSGIYYVKVATGGKTVTAKMLMLK